MASKTSKLKHSALLIFLFCVGVSLAFLCLYRKLLLQSELLDPYIDNLQLLLTTVFPFKFPLPDGSAAMGLVTNLAVLFIAGWPLSLWVDNYIDARDRDRKQQEWNIVKGFIQARLLQISNDFLETFKNFSDYSEGFYYQFGHCWQLSEFDRNKDGLDWCIWCAERSKEKIDKLEQFATIEKKDDVIEKIEEINKTIERTLKALERELMIIAPLVDSRIDKSNEIYETALEFISALRKIQTSRIKFDKVRNDPKGEEFEIYVLLFAGSNFWQKIAARAETMLTSEAYFDKLKTKEMDSKKFRERLKQARERL